MYTGLFRVGDKKKITMESSAKTLSEAEKEFQQYAKEKDLIFIRAYEPPKEEPIIHSQPSARTIMTVMKWIVSRSDVPKNYKRCLEWMEGEGMIIKTTSVDFPSGYKTQNQKTIRKRRKP